MIRKKLYVFFNSYKSSAKHKPMALVILFISVAVAIITCGWGTRMITAGVELNLYESLSVRVNKDLKYDDAGELIIKLRDDGLFGVDSNVNIDFKLKDLIIKANDNEINTDDEQINFVSCYYGNEFISEKQILNNENVLCISQLLATELNVVEGDIISLDENEFVVSSILENHDTSLNIYLPYNADFNHDKIDLTEETLSNGIKSTPTWAYFNGLERLMTSGEKNALLEVGIIAEHYPPVSAAWVWVWIMLILMVVINIINIVVVAKYWLRVNDRKYAVMKITGAPPETIAGAMTLEAMGTTIAGAGLGLIIEYLISFYVLQVIFKKLLWLHYALLLPIVLSAVIVPLVVKVIKRARSTALDRRMYL